MKTIKTGPSRELSESKDSNWEQERMEWEERNSHYNCQWIMISRRMGWSWPVVLFIMAVLIKSSSPYMSSYCYFNQLCTCKLQSSSGQNNLTESETPLTAIQSLLQTPVDIRDVTCLGVPFAQIPGKVFNPLWVFYKCMICNAEVTLKRNLAWKNQVDTLFTWS